ncbi:malate dehydrogenase [Sesamum angolense]|uniref:malate dehydrogenase n=1 Tax=Sesamum angolense TaxID=2727404 RepID=A0AAE1X6V7_9LAMI|nr:malate dehydrogenase [Sesamum angolense]
MYKKRKKKRKNRECDFRLEMTAKMIISSCELGQADGRNTGANSTICIDFGALGVKFLDDVCVDANSTNCASITYTRIFLGFHVEHLDSEFDGFTGQIGYALVPMIARGVMLGPDQPVILHMLDIPPAAEALNGVKMELVDAAFPLLKGVVATTDAVEACTGVNVAVMVGGFPRKEGMERKDVMSKNVSIYKSQASALEKHAAANCKISERLNVQVSDVKNVIIWGNHSSTQYPDVNHSIVKTPAGEKPVRQLVANDEWLNGEFITTVQQRGAAIIKARKLSSALSAASSACDHIRDWVLGTPEGTWVSMGVYSDGSYNVPAGLIYSFPVTCKNGEWSIVQGLPIDEFSRKKLDLTAQELSEEKALAYSCLS